MQFPREPALLKSGLLLVMVALHGFVVAPVSSYAGSWTIFKDSDEQVEFISIGIPEKSRLEDEETTTIVWAFESIEDETNGYVDATRLKEGSFAAFDVISQAADLRAGVEKSGNTEVIDQRTPNFSGAPAVELWTKTQSPQGNSWFGVIRMFVVGDTLYTLGLNAPTISQLEQDEAQEFLSSLNPPK